MFRRIGLTWLAKYSGGNGPGVTGLSANGPGVEAYLAVSIGMMNHPLWTPWGVSGIGDAGGAGVIGLCSKGSGAGVAGENTSAAMAPA